MWVFFPDSLGDLRDRSDSPLPSKKGFVVISDLLYWISLPFCLCGSEVFCVTYFLYTVMVSLFYFKVTDWGFFHSRFLSDCFLILTRRISLSYLISLVSIRWFILVLLLHTCFTLQVISLSLLTFVTLSLKPHFFYVTVDFLSYVSKSFNGLTRLLSWLLDFLSIEL